MCVCFPELDLIPAVVTFVSCLMLRLELGIVIGIAVNLLFLLYASARPSVKVTTAVVRTTYIVPSIMSYLYEVLCYIR